MIYKNILLSILSLLISPIYAWTPSEYTIFTTLQYKVAADSALRAVKNPICNPLKLPPEKYEKWKVMTLNFDPRHMFGK